MQGREMEAGGPLVGGGRAGLGVTVKNKGEAAGGKLAVKLTVEDGLPAVETIEGLKTGESKAVRFQPTFFLKQEDPNDGKTLAKAEPRRVTGRWPTRPWRDDPRSRPGGRPDVG